MANPSSGRHAVNCAITAYHMAEWVWGDWLNKDYATQNALNIRDRNQFLGWIDNELPWFKAAQTISNGSKHFIQSHSEQTKVAGAFAANTFQRDAFDVQHLELEVDGISGDKKWVPADIVLETVVIFWRDFFLKYGPYKTQLPTSRYPFTEFK